MKLLISSFIFLIGINVFTSCSFTNKPGLKMNTIDFQAHRGGRGLMPENTIPAMIAIAAFWNCIFLLHTRIPTTLDAVSCTSTTMYQSSRELQGESVYLVHPSLHRISSHAWLYWMRQTHSCIS